MLQKIKKMMKGICSSERIKMLSLMLLVGTVTAFAQNAAGDYSAGTTASHGDGRNRQVRAVCGETVLRHCRYCSRCGSNQCVYKNEQRGTGC